MPEASPQPLTIEQFRQLHPWPPEQRRIGRPREWLWHFDLPSSPADVYWSVGDTERTNRAAGLNTMQYEEVGGDLVGSHVIAGMRNEFLERWQWVAGSSIELVREYRSGIARLMRTTYRFEPGPGGRGTRVYIYYGWIPRGLLGLLVIRVGMYIYERRFRTLVGRICSHMEAWRAPVSAPGKPGSAAGPGAPQAGSAAHDAAALMRRPGPRLDQNRQRRIEGLRGELQARGVDADALDRLVGLASSADDLELDRIRVRRLAREWGLDELLVIRTALHATRAGLLQLTWDVMCPHCRGVRQKLASLGEVPERSSCDVCEIEFGTEGENAIEVTFRVHPSIRDLPDTVYCSAQPMRRRHIRLQQRIEPGAAREIETRLEPGRYRLRRRAQEPMAYLQVLDRFAAGQRVEWLHPAAPSHAEVGRDPVLVVRAPDDREDVVVLEEEEWDGDALLPVHLFNMQDFRDLFSEEYLAAGVRLYVGEQTILFSDIIGSTRLYAAAGDPAAFIAVKNHFAHIYEQVAAHTGVVVKTIGDAVMAAFSDPKNAIAAARDIHRRFPGPNGGAPNSVRVRISIHTGSCIAVNLNSGIDYFGGTVNTAAKLQRCAGAGETALSESVERAPGVAEALRLYGGSVRRDVLEHDALGRLPVAVWSPSTGPREAGAGDSEASALAGRDRSGDPDQGSVVSSRPTEAAVRRGADEVGGVPRRNRPAERGSAKP